MRRQWGDDDMKSAMSAVRNKEMTIYKAAAHFKVPRKTLDDRIKGRVKHGTNPGPSTVLSASEEASLVSYLVYMANRGFPLTRTMVKAFAWAVAKRSGKSDRFSAEYGPGEHWWFNFKRRHPEVTLRRTDMLERTRAEALNPDVVTEYFEHLGKTLDDHGLKNKPRQLYNCDESFVPLDCSREKAVTMKGAKNVYCQTHGTKEHITLLCCASAAGIPHPPMIIYAKSFPGGQYRFDGPDDTLYAKSESGWIDSELFMVWIKKIFLKYAVPQRPVLLLIDGHKSHINIDVIDLCRSNNVILYCLPPHTTHALQPLDVAVFKPLKDYYSKAVRALSFSKKNFVVSRREFSKVIKGPLDRAFSIPNIKSGFAKCGIFPFNPDAVPKHKMGPSSLHRGSLSSTDSSSESSISCPSSVPNLSSHSSSSPESSIPSPAPSQCPSQLSQQSPDISSSSSDVLRPIVSTVLTSTSQTLVLSPSNISPHQVTPPTFSSPPNPLVMAGLVPEDLSDIFLTPQEDAAVLKRREKRITGARNLTSDEYVEMLKECERKKKEEEELKKQKKEEREKKKTEREKKKEEVQKRKREKVEKKKGKCKSVKRAPLHRRIRLSSSESENSDVSPSLAKKRCEEPDPETDDEYEESDIDCGKNPGPSNPSSRSQRSIRLPARFRNDSDDDVESICSICNCTEPVGVSSGTIFWVDCNKCGVWVHNYCAFKKNAVTRQFICRDCSK